MEAAQEGYGTLRAALSRREPPKPLICGQLSFPDGTDERWAAVIFGFAGGLDASAAVLFVLSPELRFHEAVDVPAAHANEPEG